MKNRIFSIGLVAFLCAACSINELDYTTPIYDKGKVLYATIEDASTRVFVNNDLKVLWHADDCVSVFNKYTDNQQYRFTGNTGANSGSFTKITNNDLVTSNVLNYVYAIYPYNESTEISNLGVLTIELPASQSYAEDSFGIGANTMVSCTADDKLMFKNLCGYLLLKLYGNGISVSSISIKGNTGENLAGRASVTSSPDGVPSFSFSASATQEITVDMTQPVRLGTSTSEATTFWVVIPPVVFSQGFTLTVYDEQGKTIKKTTSKPIEIKRNTVTRMKAIELETSADPFYYVDEFGVDQGPGITVDGITWAPVNCGYKPATLESKGFVYGKLYQYGRKYGQGYGSPYSDDTSNFEDESIPNYDVPWSGKNEEADANTFFFSIFDPYDWITSGSQFWNDGTESEPKKNTLYDPCPTGWRVPTATELSKLAEGHHSDLEEINGVYGVWYSGSKVYDEHLEEKVFLPAGGGRYADIFDHNYGAYGRGISGYYWTSSLQDSYALKMSLFEHNLTPISRASGFSIRCCRDNSTTDIVPVSSITLDKTSLTLEPGSSETLHATVLPENATEKAVSWTSSNTTVATVSNGTVTAVAAGTTTITAVAGGKVATCEVTVPESSIESMVKVSFSGIDITSGGSMSYEAPYWMLTAGAKISVSITNTSSKTITLTSFRLICAKTGTTKTYSVSDDVERGKTNRYQISLPGTFYSPFAEFTYQCGTETYKSITQYNGSF